MEAKDRLEMYRLMIKDIHARGHNLSTRERNFMGDRLRAIEAGCKYDPYLDAELRKIHIQRISWPRDWLARSQHTITYTGEDCS